MRRRIGSPAVHAGRLRTSLVLAILACSLIIPQLGGTAQRTLPLFAMPTGAESVDANLTYLYPAPNESSSSANAALASDTFNDLGLRGGQLESFNQTAGADDPQNETLLPDRTYLDGPVARFVGVGWWASFMYSLGGRFEGSLVAGSGLYPSGPSMSDKVNATRSIISALKIPVTGTETWNVTNESVLVLQPTPTWLNTTLLQIESYQGGIPLSPANRFAVRLTNYAPYTAVRLVISAWVSANWNAILPYETLRQAATGYLTGQVQNRTFGNVSPTALTPDVDHGFVYTVLSAPIYGGSAPGDAFVWVDAFSASVDHATFWYYYGTGTGPPGSGSLLFRAITIVSVVAGFLLAAAVIVRRREGVTQALFSALAIVGGSRPDEPHGNFMRGQIYGFILANPGATYSNLLAALRLANGVLSYHLWVLERDGLIKGRNHGARKSFYPAEQRTPAFEPAVLSQVQADIYRVVESSPWISQKEIARRLHLPRRRASYQVKRLTSLGFLTVRGKGRGKRCAVMGPESQLPETRPHPE